MITACLFSVHGQVLSNSVAVALRQMEGEEVEETANFVEYFDKFLTVSMLETSPVESDQETHSSLHTILAVTSD